VVLQALDESSTVALDTETTGLNPRRDRLRILSLATDRGIYLVDCFAVDPRPLWTALAERTLLGHNLAFDLGFLRTLGFTSGSVRDTLLLSQLLYAGRHESHKLQDCVQRELGKELDKTQQTADWSKDLSRSQLEYASADVQVLVPLCQVLERKIHEAQLTETAQIEHGCLPALVWLAQSGVAFNAHTWEARAAEAEDQVQRLVKELDALAPVSRQPGVFDSG
jgi:ribonuclease D